MPLPPCSSWLQPPGHIWAHFDRPTIPKFRTVRRVRIGSEQVHHVGDDPINKEPELPFAASPEDPTSDGADENDPDREALISPDFYKRRNQLVQNRIATLRAQGFTAEQIQALQRAEQLPEDMALSTELIARQQQVPVAGPEGKAPTATPMSDVEIQAMRERFKEARNPVERVRGFADQINWEYAVIQRLNKAELKTELIPFNLAKAVIDKDPAHNLQLQPDDVVTIMSSADLRLPVAKQTRLVRIEGEVASPGVYQARPGETIPQLIQRAGGLTPQAYLYGIEFTRETVRRQQQQNLDQLIRRLEAQMQSAGATLTANLTGERALQAQNLQQQQQQQMQAQISRLKTLRSKGRVALELDPAIVAASASWERAPDREQMAQALDNLPSLPLEDGDRVVVPFVIACGQCFFQVPLVHHTISIT